MKKIVGKTKRFLSIFMALMMIVSVIPASSLNVYAEENGGVNPVEFTEASADLANGIVNPVEYAEASADLANGIVNPVEYAEASDDLANDIVNQIETTEATGELDVDFDNPVEDEKKVESKIDEVDIETLDENSEISEEALQENENIIELKWADGESGAVDFYLYQELEDIKIIEVNLVKEGSTEILDTETISLERVTIGEGYQASFAPYMNKSGNYRAYVSVAGVEYSTPIWNYVKPSNMYGTPENIELIYNNKNKPVQVAFDVEEEGDDAFINFVLTNLDTNESRCGNVVYDPYNSILSVDGKRKVFLQLEMLEEYYHLYDVIKENSRFKISIVLYSGCGGSILEKAVSEVAQAEFTWSKDAQNIELGWEKDDDGYNTGRVLIKFANKPNTISVNVIGEKNQYVGEFAVDDENKKQITIDVRKYISAYWHNTVYATVDGKTYISEKFVYYAPDKKCPTPTNIIWERDDEDRISAVSWNSVNTEDLAYEYIITLINESTGEKRYFVVSNDTSIAEERVSYSFPQKLYEDFLIAGNKYKVDVVTCSKEGILDMRNSDAATSVYNWSDSSNIEMKWENGGIEYYINAIPKGAIISFSLLNGSSEIASETITVTDDNLYVKSRKEFRQYISKSGEYKVVATVGEDSYESDIWSYNMPTEKLSAVEEEYIDWLYTSSGDLVGIRCPSYYGFDIVGTITNLSTQNSKSFVLSQKTTLLFEEGFSDIVKKGDSICAEFVCWPSGEDDEYTLENYAPGEKLTKEFNVDDFTQKVSAELDENYLSLKLSTIPNNSVMSIYLYRNNTLIKSYVSSYNIAYSNRNICVANYINETGTYKARVVIDGVEYCSNEFKYVRPSKVFAKPQNLKVTYDDNGKPKLCEFDMNIVELLASVDEEDYLTFDIQYIISNVETGEQITTQSYFRSKNDFEDGKRHEIIDLNRHKLKPNCDYQIEIFLSDNNYTDIGVSETAVCEFTWYKAVKHFNGPQNLQMDTKTGELSFVTGDDSNGEDELTYKFMLLKEDDDDSRPIKIISYKVENSGTAGKVSFAGLYRKTNTYKIEISPSKKVESGDYIYDTYEYTFDYVAPDTKMTIPSNIKLEGTILNWDKVEDAKCYQVKVEYCFEGMEDDIWESYIATDTNSADIKAYATDKYKDVHVSVCAVAADATKVAPSDFSSKIEYIYVPEVTNIEWNVDETGKPVSISWDLDENFTEDYFDYVLELTSKFENFHNFEYPFIGNDNSKVENGRVIYTIPDWYHTTAGMITYNDLFNAVITARDLSDHNIVIASGEKSYEWGTVRAVPNGPSNVEYDSKTGILTFISGDDYNEALNIRYNVNLTKNKKWIGGESYFPSKKGESVSIDLARFFDEAGTYTLNLYAMYKNTGGNTYSYEYEKNVDYSKAEQSLAVPSNVRLEDGIAKWDSVANAQGYSVDILAPGDIECNEYTPVNSIDLSEYINSYDEFTFTVVAVTNDFSKFSNSAKSDSVEYKQPVVIKWDKEHGGVQYIFNVKPNTEKCAKRVFRNGKLIFTDSYAVEGFCYLPISVYMNESGTYKAEYIEDGKVYSSEEWNYIMPSKKAKPMSNIKWETDNNGRPVAITFDKYEYFVEGLYYYTCTIADTSDSLENQSFIISSYETTEDGNNRLRYTLPLELANSFEENKKYEFWVADKSGDIQVLYAENNNYLRSVYVWGTAEEKYVGPQNINFNIGTGILEYTDGDAAPEGNDYLNYFFSLSYEGHIITNSLITPIEVGRERKKSFTGYIDETGHYTMTVSCLADGYTSVLAVYEYDYVKPQTKLASPSKVMYDGKKVKWSSVEDAYSYSVKIEYDNENSTGVTNRVSCIYNQMEGNNTFDTTSITSYPGIKNVEVSVAAIPYDVTEVAISDYTLSQRYAFNTVVSEMTVGDPATKQADIHVINISGAKASGVTYSSSNPEVATVSTSGIVTAKSSGTTIITAKVKGYATPLSMTICVYEDLYDMGFVDSSKKSFYDSDEEDTLQIYTTPLGIGTASISCTASGSTESGDALTVNHFANGTVSGSNVYLGGVELLEVVNDTSDATGKTYKVTAKNLDEITEEIAVNVTIEVTANSGKIFSKTKTYVLVPKEDIPYVSGYYYYTYGARDKVLGNVKIQDSENTGLPEGWEWINSSLDISKYVGENVYTFSVVNHTKTKGNVYDWVCVKFELPSTTDFDNIQTKWCVGDSKEIAIDVGYLKSISNDEVRIKSSNSKIFEVIEGEGNKFTLTAKTKGTATLTYLVGGIKVASKKITIVAGDCLSSADDISFAIKDANGITIEAEEGKYSVDITNGICEYSIETIAKLTIDEKEIPFTTNVISSDPSVLKITNGSKLSNGKRAKLTFTGAGDVYITITANDVLKTSKTFKIHVVDKSDKAVTLSKNVITYNTARESYFERFYVIEGGDRKLNDLQVFDASVFDKQCQPTVSNDELNKNIIEFCFEFYGNDVHLKPSDIETLEPGKYVIALYYGVGDDKEVFYKPITINKTYIKPSIGITQKSKADFAYAEQSAEYYINSNGALLYDVKVDNLTEDDYSYDYQTSVLKINNLKGQKKLTIKFKVESYNKFAEEVDVKTSESRFALSSTSGTIYSDVEGTYLEVYVKNSTKKTVVEDDGHLSFNQEDCDYDITYAGNGIYRITVKDGKTPSGSKKLKLTYTSDKLEKDYSFSYTVKAVKLSKAKLVLGAKSLTLYSYPNQSAEVDTTLKLQGGCAALELFDGVEITEKKNSKLEPSLGRTLGLDYDKETGKIKVTKVSDELEAGTYNFVITLKDESLPKGKISVTLPIKVVKVTGSGKKVASVKVSVKNKVDLLNRENTTVVCTPKFTNIPAGAEYEIVDIIGKNSSIFAICDANNIRLSSWNNVIEKETYDIQLVYQVKANGATVRVTSQKINLKFKTKKATVKILSKADNIFNCSSDLKVITFAAFDGQYSTAIERVELVNTNNAFIASMDFDDSYDVIIYYSPNEKVQRGKTYTLTFNVYLRDAAIDSKPVTVTYKVKTAK